MEFSKLEKNLGVRFKDINLLKQALTHRSYLNENPSWPLGHNERLEFLGDAVLEIAVTEHLFRNYQNPEGDLTAFRAALVNATELAIVAGELEINDFLLLSRGEAKELGRARQDILANTFEAVAGAIYLDQGYEAAAGFISRALLQKLPFIIKADLWRDPKSKFQEEAQERVGITPSYNVIREWGPDHAKSFLVGVHLGDEEIATGEGPSKQEAEKNAATKALEVKGW